MKRAVLELGLLVVLTLFVGTVYAVWNSRDPKRGIPWVSRLLPEGIRCPKARAGDAGSAPDAPSKFRFIDHEETWERYEARDAIFIDARRTGEYEKGHIRGAISIPFWEEETARERMLRFRDETPLDHPIVLYCTQASDCEDSQELAAALYNLGFRDLMVYSGGFPEWEEKAKDFVAKGSEPGER
ncbi:MAG: rhodanese-like domain-containing protein [Planctomycetota bacterium]